MYHIEISNGHGVFYVNGDESLVRHEIRNLPEGWRISIFDMSDPERPKFIRAEDFDLEA